ncbi:transcriptional regulator [Rathayibacter sp. VKM Ac-2759]|uniref:helix-turn-helix domain-containing protein n=1 Tax=Rathayibacter sp. VKM Ac-2759 TaxID=2609252 RepID=UPI0013174200|nr:helix-turn-helix domain-containing protein [Rathayibacter sp. VKM Ac-2759]QHC65793.1 transcriptional regulator [Rathayibacter sp. VKM Ac-2759]
MTNPWLARPGSGRRRPLVEASWERARGRRLDPDRLTAPLTFSSADLREYRMGHPLASVLPVIRRLLVRDADEDSGVLVAVGDALGRLLWIDGDQRLKGLAEGMSFVEGAAWAEPDVGTSAPGTALVLDHGVQIHGAEHFASLVHPWSCTAVPIHDPETHEILGVIDITGGAEVVAPQTLPLMEATAAAVESELLIQRLRRPRHPRRPRQAAARAPSLRVLGRGTGLVTADEVVLELSARHAEILTLLAWHRAGLSAEQLALHLHGREEAVVTVRAEMVRLRKILEPSLPRLVPLSRPYRLGTPVDLDARQVLGLLDRGSHRLALDAYAGPPLPGSEAPGIRAIADELRARVRESILTSAAAPTLLAYANGPHGGDDAEVWTELLHLLPLRSPRRAGVVARLEALERD